MIINGDCLEEMRKMETNSISCIVTDPPYGLHFMGKDWDSFKFKSNQGKGTNWNASADGKRNVNCSDSDGSYLAGTYDDRRNDEFQSFIEQFGYEALRIVKPGGHVLMFGAPRRYHRQVCGLEDSGWEIRDCLMWIFGSGFPKSHNHFGIEGYGTALKPAYEPIIMAMKSCDGTFKENAQKWGQAGINIDVCRIPTCDKTGRPKGPDGNCYGHYAPIITQTHPKGRWPANVMFDEEAAKVLDEQSGTLKSGKPGCRKRDWVGYSAGLKTLEKESGFGDSGGASRFFYCAKASSRERNEGLEGMPEKENPYASMGINTDIGIKERGRSPENQSRKQSNFHPTVKPLKLMEYLIKLVMPPKDGLLLDPFAGSGTTILAAKRLGFNAIGIEKSAEYSEIARARIAQIPIPKESKELDLFASCG